MSLAHLHFVILCLVCGCGYAGAKEIHASPRGNDSWPGTADRPKATPHAAADEAAKGDTIVLRGGTYTLRRLLWLDTPDVTVRSAPREKAVLVAGTREGLDPLSVVVIAAGGVKLVDLEIRGGAYYGVKIGEGEPIRGVRISGCRIYGSGRDCIKTLNADGLIIENCDIGPSGVRDPSNAEGIDSIGSVGVEIRNCHVHDTATNAIYLKGGARNGIIESCLVQNIKDWSGIILGQDTDLEFMRDGSQFEAVDCVARNNIVVNVGAAGLATYSGDNVRFENNTLVNVARNKQAAFFVVTNERGIPARRVTFKNNIVIGGSDRPLVHLQNMGDLPDMDFNLYFRQGGAGKFCYERTGEQVVYQLVNFADWQSRLRLDQNSVQSDPRLLPSQDYRPATDSPALRSGEKLSQRGLDYSGRERPAGSACDIGAHQNE